jgi:hypothetical protein
MLNIPNKVKEINSSSFEDLTDELLTSQKPVILRGLVNHWELTKKGKESDDSARKYINNFYNDKPVHILTAPAEVKGRYFYNDDLSGFNFERKNALLSNVLEEIISKSTQPNSKTQYVGSTSVDHILPGFRNENDIPKLKDDSLISIWIGNQSRIAAHYDIPENLACTVVGKRRFTLFPPEQLENLYVGPLDFTLAGQPASLVDFHNPDFKKFPKFKEAIKNAQVAEVEAGDAIFIPSMWWHHVESLSQFNVLINYWWRQVGLYMGAPLDALNHALLSIKDLPEEQRKAWRNIFDYYIFSPQNQNHIPQDKRGVLNPIDENLARQLRALLLNRLNR